MGKNTFGNNSQGWLIKKPGNELNIGWTYVPNEMNFHPVNFGEWEHIALCFDDNSNSLVKFINGEARRVGMSTLASTLLLMSST